MQGITVRNLGGVCLTAVLVLTGCRSAEKGHADSGTESRQSAAANAPATTSNHSASANMNSGSDTDILRATAERVWTARRDRDCATVAKYLDPKEYANLNDEDRLAVCDGDPFRYQRFSISKVEVEGGFGWVHLNYATKLVAFDKEDPQEVDTIEKWRLVDQQWYPVASRIQETCPETPSIRNSAKEASLKARFEETWPLRVSQNWNALYEMVDPKDKGRVSQSDFVEAEGLIHYFAYELDWVQVIGEVGEVRVTYDNKLADPNMTRFPARKINLSEHYVLRNGVWYRDLVRAN